MDYVAMAMNDIDDIFYKLNVFDLMTNNIFIQFDDRFATLTNDFFFNVFIIFSRLTISSFLKRIIRNIDSDN